MAIVINGIYSLSRRGFSAPKVRGMVRNAGKSMVPADPATWRQLWPESYQLQSVAPIGKTIGKW